MNPQALQQVRSISQEQFQPFLNQHKLLIDEINDKINKINPGDSSDVIARINSILEQENQIKQELKHENDLLREMIKKQKDSYVTQQTSLNTQVTTLLTEFTERMSNRIQKLEDGEVTVTLPTEKIANAIDVYYQESIKRATLTIALLTSELRELKTKRDQHEDLQKKLENTEECLSDDMNPIVRASVQETVDKLKTEIVECNFDQIVHEIERTESDISQAKNKLQELGRHHL